MGERRKLKSRNMDKEPMDRENSGEGRIECGRWEWVGQGRVKGEGNGVSYT